MIISNIISKIKGKFLKKYETNILIDEFNIDIPMTKQVPTYEDKKALLCAKYGTTNPKVTTATQSMA